MNGNSHRGSKPNLTNKGGMNVLYHIPPQMSNQNLRGLFLMATVAEMVTNRIIEKLESGVIPWFKPWDGGESVNYVTRKPYRGINRLLLDGGEYLTFNQIQKLGGHIKKGSKANMVVFYKPIQITDDETDEIKDIRLLRYYKVFSLDDVEGIPSKLTVIDKENYSIDKCQSVIDSYVTKSGIKFKNRLNSKAYYSPDKDMVMLPKIEQFNSSEHYYATAFHELVHSTGHEKRLDRLTNTAHFGNSEYSREELIAEIGSAVLCNHTGIDSADIIDNSAAYIQSWLQALKNDVNMVLAASAKAEKAVEYILK